MLPVQDYSIEIPAYNFDLYTYRVSHIRKGTNQKLCDSVNCQNRISPTVVQEVLNNVVNY